MHLRIAISGILALICGCASKSDPLWYRQPASDVWASTADAAAGNEAALRKAFLAAYTQVTMPLVNAGEDTEGIRENFETILTGSTDATFASALERESPKIRSAVREFISPAIKTEYPRTYLLLASAPTIDWPSDKAYRKSWIVAGQTPPEKPKWK